MWLTGSRGTSVNMEREKTQKGDENMEDEEVASFLVLLGLGGLKKEEEKEGKRAKKRPRPRARLTRRKYDRERKKRRKEYKKKIESDVQIFDTPDVPLSSSSYEMYWPPDNYYYECRIIDFIQINGSMYYDIQFVDDDLIVENVEAHRVLPFRASCRKLPNRGVIF